MLKAATLLVLVAAVLSASYSSLAWAEDLSAVSKKGSYRLQKLTGSNKCMEEKAELEYPVFGRPALDKAVRAWAERLFAREMSEYKRFCADAEDDGWMYSAGPSEVVSTPGTLSIAFGIEAFTGGAHGSHGVETMIFDAQGSELGYRDLFLKTEGLWKFLSEYAFSALKRKVMSEEMLRGGLEPQADSFKHFVVTPQGLTLIFPEYQVASYVEGEQRVDVPLKALAKFSPQPGIWGAAAGGAAKPSAAKGFSPSFDCAKASNSVEHAICANPVLAELDVRVDAAYNKAISAAPNKANALRTEQRQWLKQMHTQCAAATDFSCLERHDNQRLTQLEK